MIVSIRDASQGTLCHAGAPPHPTRDGPSFAGTLQDVLAPPQQIRFSAHAAQRLSQRAIQLTSKQQERLDQVVGQAAATGARESLLLIDGLAFVVNVPKRTVITAMPVAEMNDTVITNIDSAVVTPTGTGPRKNGQEGLAPLWEAQAPRTA